jgi:hypothetical protein
MKREQSDPFSLSFLDVISCGFGAVVMLILIFKPEIEPNQNQDKTSAVSLDLFAEISSLTDLRNQLSEAIESKDSTSVTGNLVASSLAASLDKENQRLEATVVQIEELKSQLLEISSRVQIVKRAALSQGKADELDAEIAGIPVDRRYVVFIVDTSGSMKQIWGRVSNVMDRILEIHPKVDGFQILNDNGNYLVSGYERKWMQDTPTMRKRALNLFSTWGSASNSSPYEGMQRALNDYRNYQSELSIYVLGDDFTGADFDSVLKDISKLNSRRARINGLSFISPLASTDRFGTLMREVSQANDGAFLSMN